VERLASNTSEVLTMKVYQAKKIVDDGMVFIGVGGLTPWATGTLPNGTTGEVVPKVAYDSQITDLVGMKKADLIHYVIPDNVNGTIEQLGQKWRILSEAEAIPQNCKWVYVQAWLNYDNFPIVTYRQTGVYTGVQLNDGVPVNKQILLPVDIKDKGFLLVMSNRSPMTRDVIQKESVEFIIEL
jgi:hypothetical protein